MCLRIRKDDKENFLPKLAEKDIECYKILKQDSNYCYYTPYEECEVDVDEVFKANTNRKYYSEYKDKYWNMPFPENALRGDICKIQDFPEYHLGPGMVHVFASLEDTKNEVECLEWSGLRYCIWKCVIPAGTRYYTGHYCEVEPSYGAEEIKFVEKIKKA